jgi:tetratricopeptide (TPR) repeat protein
MLRTLAFAGTVVAVLLIPPVEASDSATTTGACSPIVLDHGGTTSISFGSCTTHITANYTYTLDAATTAALAQHYGVTETAVVNFFQQINGEQLRPYEIPQRLDALVRDVKRLREELSKVSIWEDTKPLWQQAVQALDDGKIDLAIQLYQQIVDQSQPATRQAMEALLTVARATRSIGELQVAKRQYKQAAAQFESAFNILPPIQKFERARLATLWADAEELNESDPATTLKRADFAVSLTTEVADQLPEWQLRAILVKIRALLASVKPDAALQLFDEKAVPLLENPSLQESAVSLFCFACAGAALIDERNYEQAITILEKGIHYSSHQVSPDNQMMGITYLNLSSAYAALKNRDKEVEAVKLSRHYLGLAQPDEMLPDFAFLFVNEAHLAASSDEKEKDYLRAIDIVSRLLPYDNEIYRDILVDVIDAGPDVINFGAGPIRVGDFEPSENYYEKIIHIQLKNMVALTTSPESQAASFDAIGNFLASKHKYDISLKFFRAALDIYTGKVPDRELAVASFNYANILARALHGDPDDAESHYEQALKLYIQFEGNLSEHAVDTRAVLFAFYVNRGKIDAARKLVDDYEQSIKTRPLPKEVQDNLAKLRAVLDRK